METLLRFGTLSFHGLQNPILDILMAFLLIWCLYNALDIIKIKMGIKEKSESINFDLWRFFMYMLRYAGIGIIAGGIMMILFVYLNEIIIIQLSDYSSLLFFGILILSISQGFRKFFKETAKAK